ncbi:MAG: DNA polymerase III subunit chi [Magnetospiraceae bacterium]
MTEVAFYHLTQRPLEWALPKLLEKTLEAGARALVVTGSTARMEMLDTALWSYDPASWLPHGRDGDPSPAAQPIWLTVGRENLNDASYLFLTDGVEMVDLDRFDRCFDLFDGRDDAAVAAARNRWRLQKEAGREISYFQQTNTGGWQRKA